MVLTGDHEYLQEGLDHKDLREDQSRGKFRRRTALVKKQVRARFTDAL
jgi:hypothetical protein